MSSTIRGDDNMDSADVESGRAKAWVNFDGTGTIAIRSSGNVSSITDNGAGDYTVNFTTAMSSVNYSIAGSTVGDTSNWANTIKPLGTLATGSVRVRVGYANVDTYIDPTYAHIQVFGD